MTTDTVFLPLYELDSLVGAGMSDGERGFNLELWNERWKNVTEDVGDIKTEMANIRKLTMVLLISVAGWALVQLYSQVSGQLISKAHAEVPIHMTVPTK